MTKGKVGEAPHRLLRSHPGTAKQSEFFVAVVPTQFCTQKPPKRLPGLIKPLRFVNTGKRASKYLDRNIPDVSKLEPLLQFI